MLVNHVVNKPLVIPMISECAFFNEVLRNASETVVGCLFSKMYSANYDALETNTSAACCPVVLAQLSKVFPPVSAVETPRVTVHVLFHACVHETITFVSATQAYWNVF